MVDQILEGLQAPYQQGMLVGMGFNSYTQTTCLNQAVTIKKTVSTTADMIPQTVQYKTSQVSTVSEVTDSLGVSGHVAIKLGPVDASGSGKYLDETKFNESDVNYLIQVDVTNEAQPMDPPMETFNPLTNMASGNFDQIYGDTYIFDFIKGGRFQAVVSMKIIDSSSKNDIEAEASVAFAGIKDGLDASGTVNSSKDKLIKSTEMSMFISWSGGGQIKNGDAPWTMDELYTAAAQFPKLCAATPSYSYAILRKYIHLASFQQLTKQISPVSYDNASLITNDMLNDFMQYKQIYKDLQATIDGLEQKMIEFDKDADPPEADNPFVASLSKRGGLLDAKEDLLAQTTAITKCVDLLAVSPDTFKDGSKPQYADPLRWKLRLPATKPSEAAPQKGNPDIIIRGAPAVTALPDSKHEFFAQATDGMLWTRLLLPWLNSPEPGIWTSTNDKLILHSNTNPVCAQLSSGPAGGAPNDNTKITRFCVVVGANSKLYWKMNANDLGWSILQPLDAVKQHNFAGGLALCTRDSRIHLVAVGVDCRMYWLSTGPDGVWSTPMPMRGPQFHGVPSLVVSEDTDSLVLLGVGLDNTIVLNTMNKGDSGQWNGWQMNGPAYSQWPEIKAVWTHKVGEIVLPASGYGNTEITQSEILNGIWRPKAGTMDLLRPNCRGPAALFVLPARPDDHLYFVIADNGALWHATTDSSSQKPPVNWSSIANGPFRSMMPVIVAIRPDQPDASYAVYLVDLDGKLVRIFALRGEPTDAEKV